MKTYFTYENGKKATQAKSKTEAAKKLNVKTSKVIISHVHIDFIQNAEKI